MLAGIVAVAAAWPAAGLAAGRTFDVASVAPPLPGSEPLAADPSIAAGGGVIAFDAPLQLPGPVLPTGYNLGPAGIREVYAVALPARTRTLVSTTALGTPSLGASTDPSVSADGRTVAFVSNATDLAPGVGTVRDNVYVRLQSGTVELVSAAVHGGGGNGPSYQPAISADGRFVAFTSRAGDLVPGGRAARARHRPRRATSQPQVYIRDLVTGHTALVSATRRGRPANGWSSNPSISATGRYVSFDSAATDLRGSTRNHVPGVFVADLAHHRTELVSITSGGVPQNRAVGRPFRQISSISADGRLVAFDSDATNLVRFDENRRTDVFVRDRRRRRTVLVSVDDAGFEGNSDSFAPTISADGTKVAFESFASNLAVGGGPRENVFVRDLSVGATSVIDVLADGSPPGPERVADLLQRPVLSGDGGFAGFESTASSLTGSQAPRTHVFIRVMAPAAAAFAQSPPASTHSRRVSAFVVVNDPSATRMLCQVDRRPRFACRPGTITFGGLTPGRHTLSVRAGGPGLLYQPRALKATVTVTR